MIAEAHARAAARLYEARRARDALFGEDRDGLGEPAWDMLLALFVREAAGEPIERGELLAASGASPMIAARYLEWLESRGMVSRAADDRDFDRVLVRLTGRGVDRMAGYLEDSADA